MGEFPPSALCAQCRHLLLRGQTRQQVKYSNDFQCCVEQKYNASIIDTDIILLLHHDCPINELELNT